MLIRQFEARSKIDAKVYSIRGGILKYMLHVDGFI